MTDLYPFNSQSVTTVGPTGLNNAGQLASGLVVNGVYVPAILKSGMGGLTVIGSLGGVTSSGFNGAATSINNLGNAIGYSYVDAIIRHAFLYSNSVMTDIGSFGGYSAALAINDGGVIVGFASDSITLWPTLLCIPMALWPTSSQTLKVMRGMSTTGDKSWGEFLTANQSAFHAFLYSGKTLTDLSFASVPFAINDHGQIAGITFVANKQDAFIYEDGKIADLNSLIQQGSGWELTWALTSIIMDKLWAMHWSIANFVLSF
jgi:probable HAF family extracellular repeat protein